MSETNNKPAPGKSVTDSILGAMSAGFASRGVVPVPPKGRVPRRRAEPVTPVPVAAPAAEAAAIATPVRAVYQAPVDYAVPDLNFTPMTPRNPETAEDADRRMAFMRRRWARQDILAQMRANPDTVPTPALKAMAGEEDSDAAVDRVSDERAARQDALLAEEQVKRAADRARSDAEIREVEEMVRQQARDLPVSEMTRNAAARQAPARPAAKRTIRWKRVLLLLAALGGGGAVLTGGHLPTLAYLAGYEPLALPHH